MSHTPGPWKVEVGGSDRDIIVSDKGGRTIAETNASCYPYDDGLPDMFVPEALANAHLIAAAPEMLRALQACRARMMNDGYHSDEIEMADDAIAKAEGRTA